MNRLKKLFFFAGMSILTSVSAQPFNLPLNQAYSFEREQNKIREFNTSAGNFYPLLYSKQKKDSDTTTQFPSIDFNYKKKRSLLARKLFFEHLITVDTGIIRLTIDPLLNLELGAEGKEDPRESTLFKNTRGVQLQLGIGKQFAIASSFRENQANLPYYLSRRTQRSQMAFGQGRTKKFGEDGFDFSMSSAYISYSPSENINIQGGHGKHFVGSGHRSLLLSDLSFNYPFLRLNSSWFNQKLRYQNVYALLQNMNRIPSSTGTENLFERKQASFHYLEYQLHKKLSIGLFEGIIYPNLDSSGNRSAGANFWVPLIFLNSFLEAPDESGNSTLGLTIDYIPFSKLKLYQQLTVFDEKTDKIGFQTGLKWFPFKTLMIQAELNNLPTQELGSRYTHNNESLSHPFQSDLREVIGIIQFQKNRWQSRGAAHFLKAEDREIRFLDFRQSYLINPSYFLSLHLGVQYRDEETNQLYPNESLYFYFGLSTNLQNLYFNY
mgnify:CR=1 FL=1